MIIQMGTTTFHSVLLAAGEHREILLTLFIALVAAKLAAELFERIRQPAAVGEIIAGILIGPSVLNLIQPTQVLDALAEIGVIFLLFTVGLETRPSDIFKVGRTATIVAVLGVVVPFIAGWGLLSLWPGYSWIEAIFIGAAMVATSVGITARVLSGMGLITTDASRVILAAAVIDDVIGLLVLAVVSSLAAGSVDYANIGLIAFLSVAFTLLVVAFGTRVIGRFKQRIQNLRIEHSLLMFSGCPAFDQAGLRRRNAQRPAKRVRFRAPNCNPVNAKPRKSSITLRAQSPSTGSPGVPSP